MLETNQNNGKKNELVEYAETQLTDSTPRSINLNEEISRANTLIDSSINELHSSMKRVISRRDIEDHDQRIKHLDIDKIQTVTAVGRELNNLIRTKIDVMKLAHQTGCYEYDVEVEEDEPVQED